MCITLLIIGTSKRCFLNTEAHFVSLNISLKQQSEGLGTEILFLDDI